MTGKYVLIVHTMGDGEPEGDRVVFHRFEHELAATEAKFWLLAKPGFSVRIIVDEPGAQS